MKSTDIPDLFTTPWANSASTSYIRAIPSASQIGVTDGAASLHDGFPPLCFTDRTAGGSPPSGKDFNGILNWVTAQLQWSQAGGPATYSGSFSTAIGGYPETAVVASATTPGLLYVNMVDDNTTNPDTGGAGWKQIAITDDLSSFVTDTELAALIATIAQIRAAAAGKILTAGATWGAGALVALTDASTISIDLSAGINFYVSPTLGGNRTLANPSNPKVGQSGFIIVTQDGTGGRTLSFESYYKFFDGLAPDFNTAAGAVNVLTYIVVSPTQIAVTYIRGLA